MAAYYNEIDPYAAEWLRNLIKAGSIAPGDVDERSIVNVEPEEIRKYTQCHFFAGIGGWSLALRRAAWTDDRPVWTGSCPCQPFSSAGKQEAHADERHLWPAWFRLIRECRPATIFGEQVAGAIAYGWLDAVAYDLEEEGYAFSSAVLPACSVGAPHKRDRIWFVANPFYRLLSDARRGAKRGEGERNADKEGRILVDSEHAGSSAGEIAGSDSEAIFDYAQGKNSTGESARDGAAGDVANTNHQCRRREYKQPGDHGARTWTESAGNGAVADPESKRVRRGQGYIHQAHGGSNGELPQQLDGAGERILADSARQRSGACRENGEFQAQGTDRPCGDGERRRAMANPKGLRWREGQPESEGFERGLCFAGAGTSSIAMGITYFEGLEGYPGNEQNSYGGGQGENGSTPAADTQWLECPDGKVRPVKPGIRLLAHGISGRVAVVRTEEQTGAEISHWYNRIGALKAFGNAIHPDVAAAFIGGVMELMIWE